MSAAPAIHHSTIHGESYTSTHRATVEYMTWLNMISRCERDTRGPTRRLYRDRGIRLCARWRASYPEFLSDMGRRPSSSHSIDRKDPNRGYDCGKCPDCASRGGIANCRWATPLEQGANLRTAQLIEFDGERRTLTQWAKTVGIDRSALTFRLNSGWPLERALRTPRDPRTVGVMVTANGETRSIRGWARHLHVSEATIRMARAGNGDRALTVAFYLSRGPGTDPQCRPPKSAGKIAAALSSGQTAAPVAADVTILPGVAKGNGG